MPSGRKHTFLPDWMALTRFLEKVLQKETEKKRDKDIYSKSDKER